MRKIYLLLALCCMYLQGSATVYYNKTTTALQNTVNWGVNTDGTGANPTNFTTSGDVFNAYNGATGTISGALTLGTGVTLNIGNGSGALNFTIPGTAAVTGGTVNVSAAATLTISNTTMPTLGTLDAASTVIFTLAGQVIPAGSYGNLKTTNVGSTTITAGGNLSVAGTLTTTALGILDMSTFAVTAATTITNGGTILTQNTTATPLPSGKVITGTVNYNSSAASQTVVQGTYTNLTISNTGGTCSAGGNLSIVTSLNIAATGALDMGSTNVISSVTSTVGSGTLYTQYTSGAPLPSSKTWNFAVNYNNASGGQTVAAGTYVNITLGNTSGTDTANGTFNATTFTTTTGGTLDMGTVNKIGGTMSSITINGTLQTSVVTTVSATPFPGGKTWGGTGKIIFAAPTGKQTVLTGTYGCRLQISGAGINSASGTITANDSLIIGSGDTLDFANTAYQLLGSVKPGINGVMRTQNSSTTPIPAGLVWGGTVVFNRGSAQSVPAGSYNNLSIANTGTNIVSAVGNINIDGALSVAAGTFALGANQLTGAITGVTLNGVLSTSCTLNPAIPSGKNWNSGTNGTISFSSLAGRLYIPTGTYKTLTCNNTSDTNFVVGTVSVVGTFTTNGNGGVLNMGTNIISGATTITNNSTGGKLVTQAMVNPWPAGKTIAGTVIYNGVSGGQTIMADSYSTLIINNTSGINTAGGNFSASSSLTIASGVTLDMTAAYWLTSSGTSFTNNGIIKTSVPTTVTANPLPSGKNWGTAGTIIYASDTGGQTIVAGTYNNLQINNSTGTNTVGNGVVYINSSFSDTTGIVDFSGASSQLSGGLSATFSNKGTIRTSCTTNPAILSGINLGGTVIFNKSTGAQTIASGTFNNLTFNNSSGTITGSGDITVNGALTTISGGTLSMGTNAIAGTPTSITHNGTLTTSSLSSPPFPSGDWSGSGGTAQVTFASTSGGQFIPGGTYKTVTCVANISGTNTALGDVNIENSLVLSGTGGTLDMSTYMLSGSTASYTNNGTLITANSSSTPIPAGKTWVVGTTTPAGAVIYNGTGNQTIMSGSYNDITLAGTRTGSPTISLESATINIGGNFNVTATGVGSYSPGTSTVNYTTTATRNVAGITYNDLNLANGGNTKTAIGDVTVNGTLTTTSGGAFNMDVYKLSGVTTLVNNGNTKTASTANPPIPAGKNWSGTTGTVTFTSLTGQQHIPAGTYKTLTCSNTSDTNTVEGDLVITTTMQIAGAGGKLNMSSFALNSAAVTGTGATLLTQNTTSTPLPKSKTWRGPVIYNGSGNQTLVAGTYLDTVVLAGTRTGTPTITLDTGTITISADFFATYTGTVNFATTGNTFRYNNSSNGMIAPITYGYLNFTHPFPFVKTAGGNIVVKDSMRTSTGTVDLSTFTLSGTLTKIYNGGVISTSRTGTAPYASNIDWTLSGGTVQFASDTGGQVIPAGTYTNLYSSNTSGTNTAAGNLTVMGTLSMESGGGSTVSMGNNLLTGGPSFATLSPGRLKTTNSSSTPIPANATWTYNVEYARATGGQTVVVGNYNGGLTNSNTSGINSLPNLSSIVVKGNLTLNSSSVLSDSGGVINLVGNIVGAGSHVGSGKIHMVTDTVNGAETQTIDGASLTNLELDNTGGFALTGDPTISGTLTLTSGILDIGGNNLILSANTPAIAGTPGSSNMIVTSGNGHIRKMMTAAGSYTFPLGDATPNYGPITVDVSSGTFGGGAYVAVNSKGVEHPNNANTSDYISRYWNVATSGITSPVYSVVGTYTDGDIHGSEAGISSAQYTGATPWLIYDAVNSGANTVSVTGLSNTNSDISGISNTPPNVSIDPVSSICSDGSADLNAIGSGDATLTYVWTPSSGLSATTGSTVSAAPGTPGVYTYTVTVRDGNGITATASTNVSVNPAPVAGSLTGADAVCAFSTIPLGTDGDTGGIWFTNDTLVGTIDSTGMLRGRIGDSTVTAYYVITTVCGTDTASKSVIVNPLPDAGVLNYTNNHSACVGVTTNYTETVPGGVWSTSDGSVATIDTTGVVTPIIAGTITVSYTVTDSNSCSKSKTTTLNVRNFPTVAPITYTDSTVCPGSTITFSDTTVTGGTHAWGTSNNTIASINASTGVITGVNGGTATISYNFTVSGCMTSATTVVTVNPAATLTVTGTPNVCANGGTTILVGSPSGGAWSSSNTSRATVDGSGVVTGGSATGSVTITYTYTNESGCVSRKTTIVTVNSLPSVAAIGGAGSVCTGTTATVTDVTSGGVWASANSGIASIGSTGIVSGVSAGATTISYTVTSLSTGCTNTATKSFTVSVSPTVAAITAGSGLVCPNSTLALTDATTGGSWSSSDVSVGTVNSSTGVVTGKTAGTVTISYSYTNAGCTTSATTVVTVNPAATLSVTATTLLCVSATTTFTATPSGGTWSSSSASRATVGSSSGVVNGLATGNVTITYLYTNEYSCTSRSTIAATVNAQPTVATIGGATSVCEGATASVTDATTGGIWASSNTSVATIGTSGIVSGVLAGTTVVSYTVTNGTTGCSRTNTKNFTVNAIPTVPAIGAGSGHVCQSSTLALTESTIGGTHVWSSSTPSVATVGSASGVVSGVAPGTATITYSYTNVCTNTAQTVVTVNPPASAGTITGADDVTAGSSITLSDGTPGGVWSSSNNSVATVGSSSGVVNGIAPGNANITYTVTSCGTAFTTHAVSVLSPKPGAMLAPNVAFKVFPNPTSGAFTLTTGSAGTFTVFTVDGKMIAQYDITQSTSELSLPHGTAAGVYMCRYEGVDGNTVIVRLVYNP